MWILGKEWNIFLHRKENDCQQNMNKQTEELILTQTEIEVYLNSNQAHTMRPTNAVHQSHVNRLQ